MRLALPKLLAIGALSVGALSLPPLALVQRADRALFDAWSRLASPAAPPDLIVVELPEAADQAALIETARWQSARLVLTTLTDAPIVPSGPLAVLGPVAVASAGAPILRDTDWADGGYLWPHADFDGVVRFEHPVLGSRDGPASLSLAAARLLERPVDAHAGTSAAGHGAAEAANPTRLRWLRFFSPGSLQAISPEAIRFAPDALTGKIVVVGSTDDARHRTPLGPLSTAELVAHALAGYRQDAAVTTSPAWDLAGWLGAAMWIGVVAVTPASSLAGIAVPLLGAASLAAIGTVAFAAGGIWLPVAGPALLVLTLAGAATGDRRRAHAPNSAGDERRTLLDGRRLVARGELVKAWSTLRALPVNRDLIEETYALGCALAEHGEQALAADAFHRVAQADAGYKDVARKLVDACADPCRPAPEHPQPAALGRYEILGVVGSGAMGIVYLGRDPSLNRIVAIKAINLEREFDPSDLDEVRARFKREAEIAGRLNHPSIVTIYDVGEQEGMAYIAMEYVRGAHLSEHAAPDTLLPADQVLELTARAADALHHAHRHNVVHRDIKPANIMYDSVTDSLKITDFGVARLMDVSRTRTGVILGTPSYMSPEQLQGENVNGHTDLFALGVTLYQLLTGHLPFRGNSMTELMFVIANDPHIPVTDIRAELPAVLDSVLGRALAKSPGDRFSDGAAMAHALRAALAGL